MALRRGRRRGDDGIRYPRWFWPSFAAPGGAWILVLFVLPFYAVIAIAFGTFNVIFRTPVPIWNPLNWNRANFYQVFHEIFGRGAFMGPAFIRTFVYVAIATLLCIVIGYPVAYYVARHGGRHKGLLLILLIMPFWISYMMRMLAWVNLLGSPGLVNDVLVYLHVLPHPFDWLDGQPVTVVLGLVYGYIPYMVLPLFAGLDRIEPSLLEAARDLGAGRARTFVRVTLPLSKQALLAGMVIVTLPMFGDYFTNNLLSASPSTSMIGNLIDNQVGTPGQGGQAAVLVLVLTLLLVIPMLYYVYSTARAAREGLS